ncbi:hypothetical protein CYY_002959 [Polysphondylium violaceum]|uniref:TLDc domain-containing protein n=1 Tax=Polysphondylium violaceum TaxID=133409 RepID=A0A8J4Q7B7_9MYCE|nr:hypothetical protein CYY_002959 [Polysphondylium violaceum]
MIANQKLEDFERDNSRLQLENWEYKRVGCANTDHISLFTQLETSNNENDLLKQERNTLNHNVNLINENVEKLLLENKSNNNKIDLFLNKIESLVKVNDSLNQKIENLYEENKKSIDNYNNEIGLLSDKIKSLERVNQSIHQQQCTLKEQQHKSMEKIESLTKANESLHQQLKNQIYSLESKLSEQNLEIDDKESKTCKDIETCEQDLLFLKRHSFFKIIKFWINDKTIDFELLYKASNADFSTSSFHSTCDGKGPTITLIETTDGDVFGGYNSQSWSSDCKWYGDDKCFIFTLVNKHGIKPTKYSPGIQNTHYVGSGRNYGPIFGSGYDIGVGLEGGSRQRFPWTYCDTTGKGESTLTPTKYFAIKTVEIYKCI